MLECLVCTGSDLHVILDKPAVRVWTNAPDDKNKILYPCMLLQCTSCGHIQQNVDPSLQEILNNVYSSANAQLSTVLGVGNWGTARAESILKKIHVFGKKILEIGCANGYILRHLHEKNPHLELTGIEPSGENGLIDGVHFLRAFVTSSLKLRKTFDFIFAIGVFEHVMDIRDTMRFIVDHLDQHGKLLFSVPHTESLLETGCPSLFSHEHIHYYTSSSLARLMHDFGFYIHTIEIDRGSIYIHASRIKTTEPAAPVQLYPQYQQLLDEIIAMFDSTAHHAALHGVCNKLNNLLGWSSVKHFDLADNDETKVGKVFWGVPVKKPEQITNERLIIIPSVFFQDIKEKYIALGYGGLLSSL